MEERSDAELIGAASQGDREAFAALLARHYPFVFRVAYKWCGNKADAEDLAQDVCIKLGSAIGSFDGRSAFRSWLYRVTLNTVRDARKMRVRAEQRVAELALVSEASAAPAAHDDDPMDDLWEAVRALPDAERDAVLLVYSEGMNHAEAADVLGCKAGTVSWRISNAKERLKSLLKDELQ
jgi:RNA polymerase sigma-70 factor (ECF subfamily)